MPFLVPAGAVAATAAGTAVGSTAVLAPIAAGTATAAASAFTIADALSIAGLAVSAGSTLLGAMQQQKAAKAQAAAADVQSTQLEQAAGQERAASQQKAIEARRQARLAMSHNEALAGASGGGASDPTVIDIQGGIAGEGEYNAMTALYQGEARARGLEGDSVASRYEAKGLRRAGSSAKVGGIIGTAGSLLAGTGQTLMYKYG